MKACLVIFGLFLIKIINADIIVDTSLGKVAGVEVNSILKNEKYYSFMGIPYGKPPVGDLRFLVSTILFTSLIKVYILVKGKGFVLQGYKYYK